jgi:MYXO-CTERM domain-containing protein
MAAMLLATVLATTLTLTPVQDASIFHGTTGAEGLADGAGPHLWLAVTAEGLNRRTLLRFDLSAVPPGSVVQSAQLVLYESRSRSDHVVRAHRLLSAWGEGPASAGGAGTGQPAQAGDVTWLHRRHPNLAWAQAGGEHVASASAQAVFGLPNQAYALGTSAALVADVQAWLNNPASNHGWLLIGDELTTQGAKRLDSRENSSPANRPRLVLVLASDPMAGPSDGQVPLPTWAVALLALALSAALRPQQA